MSDNTLILGAFVALAITAAAFGTIISYATVDTVSAEVTDKERVTTGSGDSRSEKYLVFTNVETLENTDSLLHFKFNSSDLHGSIELGCTYEFTVTGFRIPLMSTYRNILDTKKGGCSE